MLALALAAALGAVPGVRAALPPAPVRVWSVAWAKRLVAPGMLDWKPQQLAAPAVDPTTGVVVVGTSDGWLRAMRPDGRTVWDFQAKGSFEGQPRIEDGVVYAGSDDGHLYAIVLATGVQRWRYDAGEELGTRPLVANGLVYVASLEDTVFAVDAKTGAWKWHHRREPREGFTIRGAASVAMADGAVIAAYSDGTVTALDPGTGAARWERVVAPTGPQLDVDSLQVDGGKVYAAAYSGAVVALDAATGKPVWQWSAKDASRVAVAPGAVVAVTAKEVAALSPVDGRPLWTAPLDGSPGGAPVVAGRWLLVPAGPGGLRVLELASGRTIRVFQPGSGVTAAPGFAKGSGRGYVLSDEGQLVAVDLR